ncbi:uncharacterized protein RAG0_04270 [Rhynchosporium agropyri]|uniref:Uncharacterized protein n=1 Tax=Rhynchosporium agropyri TaxID=914238 RepID=A0A1E1K894_9HELO|nr:uncharacterized protein RAG0_04270 [Rhynchosporium agropyri]
MNFRQPSEANAIRDRTAPDALLNQCAKAELPMNWRKKKHLIQYGTLFHNSTCVFGYFGWLEPSGDVRLRIGLASLRIYLVWACTGFLAR